MKYSDFLHESEVKHRSISYNLLTPKPSKGKSLKPEKIKVGPVSGTESDIILIFIKI